MTSDDGRPAVGTLDTHLIRRYLADNEADAKRAVVRDGATVNGRPAAASSQILFRGDTVAVAAAGQTFTADWFDC